MFAAAVVVSSFRMHVCVCLVGSSSSGGSFGFGFWFPPLLKTEMFTASFLGINRSLGGHEAEAAPDKQADRCLQRVAKLIR